MHTSRRLRANSVLVDLTPVLAVIGLLLITMFLTVMKPLKVVRMVTVSRVTFVTLVVAWMCVLFLMWVTAASTSVFSVSCAFVP